MMKSRYFSLGLLLAFALGACQQQDAPSGSRAPMRAEASLSSLNSGEQITLDLASIQPAIDLNEDEAQQTRALDFNYTPSSGKLELLLDRNKDTYNVLLILRPRGGSQLVYAVLPWKHLKQQRKLYIHEVQVTLPAGLSYAANDWEAMLFLVPDQMTEASLRASGYKLPYSSVIATGAPIDISQSRTLTLDIPYATAWTPLTKRQHEVSGDELSSHAFRFKPLGAVVTYRVTNSMEGSLSLSGIKVVSNAIAPQASLDLSASSLAATPAGGVGARFTDFGELYSDRTFDYTLSVSGLASQQTATTGLVVWYPTTGAPSRTSFNYNDGTPDTDLSGAISFPRFFRAQDAEVAARYATTHVYATGATKNGAVITKPNLNLVPIMGTDRALASGKSYIMPCELYEQPNLQLGYFARSPLEVVTNRATNSSSFALASETGLNNDNVPMLSLSSELVNYVDTSNPYNPRMISPIQINGQDYYLPTNDQMRASGLLSTNAIFFREKIFGSFGSAQASVAAGRGVYDRSMRPIAPQGGASEPSMIITYSDLDAHAATSLMYRSAQLSANSSAPVRNINQAVYRIQANGTSSRVSSIDVRAVYLGKYYVGDVKPFISASAWTGTAGEELLKNSVKRTFYVGGYYTAIFDRSGTPSYYSPRAGQGELGAYWTLDSYQFVRDAAGFYHASPVLGAWGIYGDDKSTWDEIWGRWTYRVAHPYSPTYQGD